MPVRWLHRRSHCRSERAAAVCLDTLGGVDRVEALRLTRGARLTQPDVRADGSIVAVQLGADDAQLVLVSDTGESIISITPYAAGTRWADPRWSPSFFAPIATRYHGRRWTPWALLRGRRGIPPAIRWWLPDLDAKAQLNSPDLAPLRARAISRGGAFYLTLGGYF